MKGWKYTNILLQWSFTHSQNSMEHIRLEWEACRIPDDTCHKCNKQKCMSPWTTIEYVLDALTFLFQLGMQLFHVVHVYVAGFRVSVNCGHQWAYCSSAGDVYGEPRWNDIDKWNWRTQRKTFHSATLSITNPTLTNLGVNLVLPVRSWQPTAWVMTWLNATLFTLPKTLWCY
jgi:hypothetical protein